MVASAIHIPRRKVFQLISCVLHTVAQTHVKVHEVCLRSPFQIRNYCAMKLHQRARDQFYPNTNEGVIRFPVPDDKVPWTVKWNDYSPAVYTSDKIIGQSWADPEISDSSFKPKWHELDKNVDRKSHHGKYDLEDGYPLNPLGRTGLEGRGRLGRWGPNHAADPVVTRWKREEGDIVKSPSGSPVLQFVAIQRGDSKEWALPGGMVDPGEKISATLQREFGEEALNSLELSCEEKAAFQELLDDFFQQGEEVRDHQERIGSACYLNNGNLLTMRTDHSTFLLGCAELNSIFTTQLYKGYVDDPRNTDNAWMETVAVNFHDETGETVGKFPLSAGDDAVNVRWTDLDSGIQLYASHADFLEMTAKLHDAHW